MQTSVTAGTIFHGTRTPLVSWFAAMWYVTNQKNGVSALGLARVLGIDYKTAWTWLHKLRRAMVRPDRDLLDGPVEVDETYVGGPEQGLHGRQTITKSIVAIAIETRGKGFGRVRLHQVPDLSAESLVGFVTDVVAPGGIVRTDAWQGYRPLARAGYDHKRTSLRVGADPAHVVMPGVHRVASLLKRWLLGTHQGSVSTEHLDYYLDEFNLPVQPAHLTGSRSAVLSARPTSSVPTPTPTKTSSAANPQADTLHWSERHTPHHRYGRTPAQARSPVSARGRDGPCARWPPSGCVSDVPVDDRDERHPTGVWWARRLAGRNVIRGHVLGRARRE